MSKQLNAVQPVLMCRDVSRSINFYKKLGFQEAFRDVPEGPRYAGVSRDGFGLHLQWHDESQWREGLCCPVTRFVVTDPDTLHAEFRAAEIAEPMTEVFDSDWGTREFHLLDPDRNGLHFYRDR